MSNFNEMTIISIIKCFQSHCAISPSRGSIDNGACHGEYTRAVEIEGSVCMCNLMKFLKMCFFKDRNIACFKINQSNGKLTILNCKIYFQNNLKKSFIFDFKCPL